ncbi:MAG: caspase family protein [Mesorhizobium sp.]|nr:caspase family protein [Mesorhizobium sp.]
MADGASRSGRSRGLGRRFAIAVAALCAALAVAPVPFGGAFAGLRVCEDGKECPPADAPSDAAAPVEGQPTNPVTAYFAELSEKAPGLVSPLLQPAELDAVASRCDRQAAPKTRAILISAQKPGEPFAELVGPDNDVVLMAASLAARGAARSDITILTGEAARSPALRTAMLETLAAVNCGDRVFLYFSGHSAPVEVMRDVLVSSETIKAQKDISIEEAVRQYTFAPERPALAWMIDSGRLLALNNDIAKHYDLIAAQSINDFVSAVRNRGADAVVILDTSHAGRVSIGRRQQDSGDSVVWSSDSRTDADPKAFYAPVKLRPARGGFAAFYSTIDEEAHELKFDTPDGETTYGLYTFRLATAIQNRDTVTANSLVGSLAPFTDELHKRYFEMQNHRVEASDAELVLFTDATLKLPAIDPIVITKPAPKRGVATMERPEVDIEGIVNWSAPAKAVLVDGRIADLGMDGTFRHKKLLKSGMNTVEIVALTADGRTHQRRLEFLFEGDKKALEGEGARYAVIVANQNYTPQTGFDPLETPFRDADAVAALLTSRYGFRTEATLPDGRKMPLVLKDATRRDIETVLYQIGLVAGEKDTVLIYYAGHGIYEEKTTIAFWVPTDAEAGVPISYLSASTIAEAVQRMQANNILVISDSCFSGALMRGGGVASDKIAEADRARALLRLTQRRTRVLISSGNNEPVEDLGGDGHSVFARALLTGLEKMEWDAFSARELFDGYILPMVLGRADQEPQYRPIERSGHEGGDIVFVRG